MARFQTQGFRLALALVWAVSLAGLPALAFAESDDSEDTQGWCKPGTWHGGAAWARTDAAIDLYNGLLWGGATVAINRGASTPSDSKWSRKNDFDKDIRSGLKLDSKQARDDAQTASDVLLFAGIVGPALADVWKTWPDCELAADIATDYAESMMLAAMISEGAKVIIGRKRPCSGIECSDVDSKKSFYSGHASMTAVGAGLACSNAFRRKIWGEGLLERAAPCGLGVAVSLTTGLLRISGDKHWATDVLVGWAVGGLIGFFDVPGPFDLLKFRWRGSDGESAAEGMVMPYAGPGRLGANLSMRF